MIRHEYSYWLSVTREKANNVTLTDVLNALNQSAMADNYMIFELAGDKITGEIVPSLGTIEEITSMASDVEVFAARFPDFRLVFDECDEQDHSNARRFIYSGGKCVFTGAARTLQPDEYDQITIDKIAGILDTSGQHIAAMIVRNYDFTA